MPGATHKLAVRRRHFFLSWSLPFDTHLLALPTASNAGPCASVARIISNALCSLLPLPHNLLRLDWIVL